MNIQSNETHLELLAGISRCIDVRNSPPESQYGAIFPPEYPVSVDKV